MDDFYLRTRVRGDGNSRYFLRVMNKKEDDCLEKPTVNSEINVSLS